MHRLFIVFFGLFHRFFPTKASVICSVALSLMTLAMPSIAFAENRYRPVKIDTKGVTVQIEDGNPIDEILRDHQKMFANATKTEDNPAGEKLTVEILQSANPNRAIPVCHDSGIRRHWIGRGDISVWTNCKWRSLILIPGPSDQIKIPMLAEPSAQEKIDVFDKVAAAGRSVKTGNDCEQASKDAQAAIGQFSNRMKWKKEAKLSLGFGNCATSAATVAEEQKHKDELGVAKDRAAALQRELIKEIDARAALEAALVESDARLRKGVIGTGFGSLVLLIALWAAQRSKFQKRLASAVSEVQGRVDVVTAQLSAQLADRDKVINIANDLRDRARLEYKSLVQAISSRAGTLWETFEVPPLTEVELASPDPRAQEASANFHRTLGYLRALSATELQLREQLKAAQKANDDTAKLLGDSSKLMPKARRIQEVSIQAMRSMCLAANALSQLTKGLLEYPRYLLEAVQGKKGELDLVPDAITKYLVPYATHRNTVASFMEDSGLKDVMPSEDSRRLICYMPELPNTFDVKAELLRWNQLAIQLGEDSKQEAAWRERLAKNFESLAPDGKVAQVSLKELRQQLLVEVGQMVVMNTRLHKDLEAYQAGAQAIPISEHPQPASRTLVPMFSVQHAQKMTQIVETCRSAFQQTGSVFLFDSRESLQAWAQFLDIPCDLDRRLRESLKQEANGQADLFETPQFTIRGLLQAFKSLSEHSPMTVRLG